MIEAILTILGVSGFLILSQLSPGPDVIFIFRTALAQGARGGLSAALGINVGFLIQSIIACTVGSWVMQQPWSSWLVLGAACWLLYLAWKIFPRNWNPDSTGFPTHQASLESLPTLAWQGFLCNILNPKCMLFILGLSLKPLQEHAETYPWYTSALVVSMFVCSLAGWCLWITLLQWLPIRTYYLSHTKGIDAIFSIALAFFAMVMILK